MEFSKTVDVAFHSDPDNDNRTSESNSDPSSYVSKWTQWLSVETGGIERVTEEERQFHTTHVWNACTFWLSANLAVATLSCGMIGPVMGLSFWSAFTIILTVNVFSCMLPAWTATFGLTGLRMTTFSRYSFGYWGNSLVVVFSLLATTGWNAINSISGASCLVALSDGKIPPYVGVVIITTTVWLICILGISWIHYIDSFIWALPLLVWCVASALLAKDSQGITSYPTTNANQPAAILSFIAVVFSFALSWVNCAADYNVRMPAHTSRSSIFTATYVGILVPTVGVQTLGVALYIAAQSDPNWKHAYATFGVGGPLAKTLEPAGGFGSFLLVLAALSSIPNNIPNNYSFALHAQNFGPWAARVPRTIFVSVGYVVAVIVGCLASLSFEKSLQTVLSIIGYWTVIHLVIVAEEHIIFRRSRWASYDLDAWNDRALLHFGWAAIGAFCFGFLGAVLGMKVTGFTGPIAKLINGGANIGHEMAFAFSGLAFLGLRWMERKLCHRA